MQSRVLASTVHRKDSDDDVPRLLGTLFSQRTGWPFEDVAESELADAGVAEAVSVGAVVLFWTAESTGLVRELIVVTDGKWAEASACAPVPVPVDAAGSTVFGFTVSREGCV